MAHVRHFCKTETMGLCLSSETQSGVSFHPDVKGQHIKFVNCFHHAERLQSFHHGLLFSDRPFHPKKKLWLRITHDEHRWYGGLRLGVTSVDPNSMIRRTLPPFSCPDLNRLRDYWAACIPEELCQTGTVISFWVNRMGQAYCQGENDRLPRLLLKGISRRTPLWAIVDVYGRTRAVQLLNSPTGRKSCPCQCRLNTVPQTQTSELSLGCEKQRVCSFSSSIGPEHDIFSYSEPPDNVSIEEDKNCVICMDGLADTILMPCRHRSFCKTCASRLREQNANCPLCRHRISWLHNTSESYGLASDSVFPFNLTETPSIKSLRRQTENLTPGVP